MINKTNRSAGCNINFVSWNVKSLNHPVKRKKVLLHLKQLKVGIAFLQETHLCKTDHSRLKCDLVGQLYHSNFNSKSRGTAILIEKNIPFEASMVEADPAGRFVIVIGKLCNISVILANVYAPNYDDSLFFTNIFSRLPNLDMHYLILGGDMNCVMSSYLDRSSAKTAIPSKSADAIKLFLDTYGISDVWRFRNPGSKSYSFFSPVHQTYSRIDYFFLDKNLLPLISYCEYCAIVISDHAPLLMTMCIPVTYDRYCPWRLNTLLLSDETFVNSISSKIKIFLEHNQTPEMPFSVIWEAMKAYLRGEIIYLSSHIRKIQTARLEELTNTILKLDATLAFTPSPALNKQRVSLQTEYNLLSTKRIENLMNKTRYRTYEYGEKTGRVLAHQLRQKTADRTITQIKDKLGNKCTEHLQINHCFYEFYSELYTSESHKDENLILSFLIKLLYPQLIVRLQLNLKPLFS